MGGEVHWFPLLGSLKNLTTGLMGGGVGRAGGAPESSVGATKSALVKRRVWGHHDTRAVGAERQIKKKVQMRGNGEGVKGTCWAPAPGVGG